MEKLFTKRPKFRIIYSLIFDPKKIKIGGGISTQKKNKFHRRGWLAMKAIGCHIIAEFSHCDSDILTDLTLIKEIMVNAALTAKAEVKETAFHRFTPQGVSGVVVIAESHLAIHTWPELGYAAIDIYTCGDSTDPWAACNYVAERLNAGDLSISEVKRGIANSRGYFSHAFSKTHISGGLQVVQSA